MVALRSFLFASAAATLCAALSSGYGAVPASDLAQRGLAEPAFVPDSTDKRTRSRHTRSLETKRVKKAFKSNILVTKYQVTPILAQINATLLQMTPSSFNIAALNLTTELGSLAGLLVDLKVEIKKTKTSASPSGLPGGGDACDELAVALAELVAEIEYVLIYITGYYAQYPDLEGLLGDLLAEIPTLLGDIILVLEGLVACVLEIIGYLLTHLNVSLKIAGLGPLGNLLGINLNL